MSTKRMLEGRNFNSKTAAALVKAFNGVVAELSLRTPAERERAAKIVIALAAGQTAIDPAKLRDDAASLVRAELVSAKGT